MTKTMVILTEIAELIKYATKFTTVSDIICRPDLRKVFTVVFHSLGTSRLEICLSFLISCKGTRLLLVWNNDIDFILATQHG